MDVDLCVKGECTLPQVAFNMSGGTVDGLTVQDLDAGGIEPPEVGRQYLFWLHASTSDPQFYFGGRGARRLLVDETTGIVPRKGIPLQELLGGLERLLERRCAEQLLVASDAVVLGTVTAIDFSHKRPAADAGPSAIGNYFELSVEDVAKGEVEPGSVVHVDLPYKLGGAVDVPRFTSGEKAVVFLMKAQKSRWTLTDGTDSRLRVREDGGFGKYGSLEDLVKTADSQ